MVEEMDTAEDPGTQKTQGHVKPAFLKSESDTQTLFGLRIWSKGFEKALAALQHELLSNAYDARIIVTPNIDHLVKLDKNRNLFDVYRQADYTFPDGFPLVLAARLVGAPLKERVTGSDLFPAVCSEVARQKGTIFILGGTPGSESTVIESLSRRYPGAAVACYAPPYGFSADSAEGVLAVEKIRERAPDAVFACLGMPKQELWAFRFQKDLKTKIVLCVGASLDFAMGKTRRAPVWVQSLNLEWFWRLCSDPARLWKRYLIDDMAFFKLLYREIRNRAVARSNVVR